MNHPIVLILMALALLLPLLGGLSLIRLAFNNAMARATNSSHPVSAGEVAHEVVRAISDLVRGRSLRVLPEVILFCLGALSTASVIIIGFAVLPRP